MEYRRFHKLTSSLMQTYEEEMYRLAFPIDLPTPAESSISEYTSPGDLQQIMAELGALTNTPTFKHLIFMTTPIEVVLEIFQYLNPLDTVCFSLLNKHINLIYRTHLQFKTNKKPSLRLGAPGSDNPVPQHRGCRHCVPVLFYPAHCQLHYHLREFMHDDLTYCGGQCNMYTRAANADRKECGACGRNYRKQYERGRRMLDMDRPGEPQKRLRKWYERSQYDSRAS